MLKWTSAKVLYDLPKQSFAPTTTIMGDRRHITKGHHAESGILRKAKPQHTAEAHLDDLLVFGYACKIFRDNDRASEIDHGKHLIPWMNDHSLKIDRLIPSKRSSPFSMYYSIKLKTNQKNGSPWDKNSFYYCLCFAKYPDDIPFIWECWLGRIRFVYRQWSCTIPLFPFRCVSECLRTVCWWTHISQIENFLNTVIRPHTKCLLCHIFR